MKAISTCIAVGMVVLAPTLASAADPSAPLEAAVRYNELDVVSDAGAKVLYARLRSAARHVCAPFEGRELNRRAQWRACYDQALSNAVQQVNRTEVTALHTRALKSEKAS